MADKTESVPTEPVVAQPTPTLQATDKDTSKDEQVTPIATADAETFGVQPEKINRDSDEDKLEFCQEKTDELSSADNEMQVEEDAKQERDVESMAVDDSPEPSKELDVSRENEKLDISPCTTQNLDSNKNAQGDGQTENLHLGLSVETDRNQREYVIDQHIEHTEEQMDIDNVKGDMTVAENEPMEKNSDALMDETKALADRNITSTREGPSVCKKVDDEVAVIKETEKPKTNEEFESSDKRSEQIEEQTKEVALTTEPENNGDQDISRKDDTVVEDEKSMETETVNKTPAETEVHMDDAKDVKSIGMGPEEWVFHARPSDSDEIKDAAKKAAEEANENCKPLSEMSCKLNELRFDPEGVKVQIISIEISFSGQHIYIHQDPEPFKIYAKDMRFVTVYTEKDGDSEKYRLYLSYRNTDNLEYIVFTFDEAKDCLYFLNVFRYLMHILYGDALLRTLQDLKPKILFRECCGVVRSLNSKEDASTANKSEEVIPIAAKSSEDAKSSTANNSEEAKPSTSNNSEEAKKSKANNSEDVKTSTANNSEDAKPSTANNSEDVKTSTASNSEDVTPTAVKYFCIVDMESICLIRQTELYSRKPAYVLYFYEQQSDDVTVVDKIVALREKITITSPKLKIEFPEVKTEIPEMMNLMKYMEPHTKEWFTDRHVKAATAEAKPEKFSHEEYLETLSIGTFKPGKGVYSAGDPPVLKDLTKEGPMDTSPAASGMLAAEGGTPDPHKEKIVLLTGQLNSALKQCGAVDESLAMMWVTAESEVQQMLDAGFVPDIDVRSGGIDPDNSEHLTQFVKEIEDDIMNEQCVQAISKTKGLKTVFAESKYAELKEITEDDELVLMKKIFFRPLTSQMTGS